MYVVSHKHDNRKTTSKSSLIFDLIWDIQSSTFFHIYELSGNVTSVLQRFRPTVRPSYATSNLLQHRTSDS